MARNKDTSTAHNKDVSMARNKDDGQSSIKSLSTSIHSLATKATSALSKLKHKAITAISPSKAQKKHRNEPQASANSSSPVSPTTRPSAFAPKPAGSSRDSHRATVEDVEDEDDIIHVLSKSEAKVEAPDDTDAQAK